MPHIVKYNLCMSSEEEEADFTESEVELDIPSDSHTVSPTSDHSDTERHTVTEEDDETASVTDDETSDNETDDQDDDSVRGYTSERRHDPKAAGHDNSERRHDPQAEGHDNGDLLKYQVIVLHGEPELERMTSLIELYRHGLLASCVADMGSNNNYMEASDDDQVWYIDGGDDDDDDDEFTDDDTDDATTEETSDQSQEEDDEDEEDDENDNDCVYDNEEERMFETPEEVYIDADGRMHFTTVEYDDGRTHYTTIEYYGTAKDEMDDDGADDNERGLTPENDSDDDEESALFKTVADDDRVEDNAADDEAGAKQTAEVCERVEEGEGEGVKRGVDGPAVAVQDDGKLFTQGLRSEAEQEPQRFDECHCNTFRSLPRHDYQQQRILEELTNHQSLTWRNHGDDRESGSSRPVSEDGHVDSSDSCLPDDLLQLMTDTADEDDLPTVATDRSVDSSVVMRR
nr:hypothetical protein BaRGS_004568 [Batillaria attramentaria]